MIGVKILPLTILFFAGCSEGDRFVSKEQAYDIADDVASEHVETLESRIAELERRLGDAEGDISGVRALGLENANNANALQDQVNSNASVANDNALAEMTRQGRCGYTQEVGPSGGIIYKPVRCTRENLRD